MLLSPIVLRLVHEHIYRKRSAEEWVYIYVCSFSVGPIAAEQYYAPTPNYFFVFEPGQTEHRCLCEIQKLHKSYVGISIFVNEIYI